VRLIFAIQLLFVLSFGQAAEVPVSDVEIPFQSRDGFILIQVTTPKWTEPLNFLLDSGAQVSVLSTATAQRLGLKDGKPVSVAGVGSRKTGFWPQQMEAHAGPVPLPGNYLRLDLSKLSEACTQTSVDGVIGADFFHDRIVQIDYTRQTVRLLPDAPAETGMQILPLKVRSCGMLVPVQINKSSPQWIRLDTGCASALQWVSASVAPGACLRRVAVALTSFSIPVTETTLTLGAVQFEKVPTDLPAHEIFPEEKGLLGNGLLCRFETVTIDAKGKKLMLQQKPGATTVLSGKVSLSNQPVPSLLGTFATH
jgi:hypothetical protein